MTHSKLTGIVITPNDAKYYKAKKNYNLAIPKNPCIIVFCLDETDVINAIKYVKENNIEFRIRSGGHDFEANSNIDCGLVIDLSKINYVKIDEDNLTATVGGGIVFGDIYSELINKGYTTPGGTCSDVGATGLTTVGGVGYATRYLGLTIDNLIEVTLIDKNANKLIINENSKSDLFWAIKGAPASSFGVITSLKYKIYKVDKVSFFVSSWYEKNYVDIINKFQHIAATIDNRITLNMELSKDEKGEVNLVVSGQFFGLPNELLNLLSQFFDICEPKFFDVKYIPYEEAIKNWGEGCHPPNKFKNSGCFIYNIISIDNIKIMIEFVKNAPRGILHYIEFLSLGGNVLDMNSESASFAHRDAMFLTQIKSIWDTKAEEDNSKQWTKLFKRFLDTIGIGNYRGFTDFDIINWQYQYFKNNYSKLQTIKDRYDSENFFKYFQGIQPTRYSFKNLTGKVIAPSSKEYEDARKDYNLYFNFYPTVIVYAYNTKDVKNAIKWANENYIGITIRCGGHNYEAFSVSDFSLLLDVSNIKKISLDRYNNLVTIGAGYNLEDLYTDLYNLGYQFT